MKRSVFLVIIIVSAVGLYYYLEKNKKVTLILKTPSSTLTKMSFHLFDKENHQLMSGTFYYEGRNVPETETVKDIYLKKGTYMVVVDFYVGNQLGGSHNFSVEVNGQNEIYIGF